MSRAAAWAALLLVLAQPAPAQWAQGKPGRVWVKSAFFLQRTDKEFDAVGQRRRRIDGGEADSRAVFTDVIVGVHPKVDIWLQIPYLDLRFTNVAESLHGSGFGDLRGWVRWQVVSLNNGATPIAVRAGAKAPLGPAPLDVTLIPIGEGQWDLEFFGEIGHSFWPVPAYAELWLGYRARFANNTTLKDPGGEFVFLTEAGVNPTSGTLLKATLDGFTSRKWTVEGIPTAKVRRIFTLQLAGGVRAINLLWLEGGVRLALAGREFPAGPQLVIALSTAFEL